LGVWSGGGTPSKANKDFWKNGTIPWVSPKDMKFGRVRTAEDMITEDAVTQSSAKFIPANSILMVTRSGILSHTFPVAVSECTVTVNQDLKTLTPLSGIDVDYVAWYLRASNGQILKACAKHGTTVASIDTERLKNFSVPIAPLKEQRRIVEKIETLFTRLDKGEEALCEVQRQLARYRQSVLKAAVTGELTADWRAQNARKLEHGKDLLARILQTRRRTWEGQGKYKEPVKPNDSELPSIPNGWVWASLDMLITDGPTNGVSPKEAWKHEGSPSFKLTATTSGKFVINENTVKWVSLEVEENDKRWLKTGDVLLQRGNTIEYVGTAAVFPGPDNKFIYPDLMMRIRFSDTPIADWAVRWINFEYAKRHFRRLATGIAGNMPKINGTTVRSLAIPLPPHEEIVRLLEVVKEEEARFEYVTHFCETELTRSAALRQSILKDAFAGRLVPQDPSDEPASELLARIRAEKADTPKKKSRIKMTA
jgi:type I restriction enzyme S subunit